MNSSSPRPPSRTSFLLLGNLIQLIILVFCTPLLINSLGLGKFALITIVFAIIGLSQVLNFGLSKSLTLEMVREGEVAGGINPWNLIANALVFQSCVGLIAGFIGFHSSSQIANLFGQSDGDAIIAIKISSVLVPIALLSSVFRGALEAKSRFLGLSVLETATASLTYLVPLSVILSGGVFSDAVISIVFVRVLALTFSAALTRKAVGKIINFWPERSSLKRMLQFGTWVAVTDLVLAIYAFTDRLLIGIFIGLNQFAIYSIIQDAVSKLWFIPGSISRVLFADASALSLSNSKSLKLFLDRANRLIYQVTLPVFGMASLYSNEIIYLWLGEQISKSSHGLFQIFIIGLGLNSISIVKSTFLYGQGFSAQRTRLHLIEIPVFLIALAALIPMFGTSGAAIAWSLRILSTNLGISFAFRKKIGMTSGTAPQISNGRYLDFFLFLTIVAIGLIEGFWFKTLLVLPILTVMVYKLFRSYKKDQS